MVDFFIIMACSFDLEAMVLVPINEQEMVDRNVCIRRLGYYLVIY